MPSIKLTHKRNPPARMGRPSAEAWHTEPCLAQPGHRPPSCLRSGPWHTTPVTRCTCVTNIHVQPLATLGWQNLNLLWKPGKVLHAHATQRALQAPWSPAYVLHGLRAHKRSSGLKVCRRDGNFSYYRARAVIFAGCSLTCTSAFK